MNLTPYVENLRRELGDDTPALEPAVRLMLLDALSAAADEITRELAPGAVELRLRSGEPEFVVAPADDAPEPEPPLPPADAGESATARINLRLPEQLKAGVEQAASRERLSVNAWLVRAVATALAGGRPPQRGAGRLGQAYTGWVR